MDLQIMCLRDGAANGRDDFGQIGWSVSAFKLLHNHQAFYPIEEQRKCGCARRWQRGMAPAHREFNVWRVMVLSMNDDEVFHPPGDIEFAVVKKTQVAGAKKVLGFSVDLGLKDFLGFFCLVPISLLDAGTRHPDFSDLVRRTGSERQGIHNPNILPTHDFSTRNQYARVVALFREFNPIVLQPAARNSRDTPGSITRRLARHH